MLYSIVVTDFAPAARQRLSNLVPRNDKREWVGATTSVHAPRLHRPEDCDVLAVDRELHQRLDQPSLL